MLYARSLRTRIEQLGLLLGDGRKLPLAPMISSRAADDKQRVAYVAVGHTIAVSRLLGRCAAKSAGERRCDVGRGYNLFGWLLRRHFLAGRRPSAWRRINETAVLDDFFNLRAVKRFEFDQRFCDHLERVAIRDKRFLRQLIRVIE